MHSMFNSLPSAERFFRMIANKHSLRPFSIHHKTHMSIKMILPNCNLKKKWADKTIKEYKKVDVWLIGKTLRLRTVSKKTCEITPVQFNFKLGFNCQTSVIFRLMKDGSLIISNLRIINCFRCRTFPKWR